MPRGMAEEGVRACIVIVRQLGHRGGRAGSARGHLEPERGLMLPCGAVDSRFFRACAAKRKEAEWAGHASTAYAATGSIFQWQTFSVPYTQQTGFVLKWNTDASRTVYSVALMALRCPHADCLYNNFFYAGAMMSPVCHLDEIKKSDAVIL